MMKKKKTEDAEEVKNMYSIYERDKRCEKKK